MLTLLAVSGLLLAAPAPYALEFFSPDDLVEPKNAVLTAFPPEFGAELITADPDRPSLWYSPAGVSVEANRTLVWYQRADASEAEYADRRTLCVGSIRGTQWSLPQVSATPPAWGGPNNVVMRRSPHEPTWGGFNVFQIVRVGDRFRMLYWDQPEEGPAGAMLAASPDGFAWEKDPRGAVFTETNDAFTLLPKDGGFILYQTMLEEWPGKPTPDNLPGKRRVQAVRVSQDLAEWSPQELFLAPDDGDPPATEFYLMKAFPYAGRFGGLLMKYYADPELPNRHSALIETELIVSDDARAWQRPFRSNNLGFWTYADPFPFNKRLAFAAGRENGLWLLQYRPHRLTGVAARGDEPGDFVTPVIPVTDIDLVIDVDARDGWIEVELLDAGSQPVPGFGLFRMENVNEEELLLEWEHFTSSELPMVQCRLRVKMKNATLFAVKHIGL